jgi:hypothetical protein
VQGNVADREKLPPVARLAGVPNHWLWSSPANDPDVKDTETVIGWLELGLKT